MHRFTIFQRFTPRLTPGLSFVAGAVLLCAAPSAAETISGVCPDGSIFIVQRRSAVPCPQAKQVDPNEIPPLNPELLPRPYGWEQFQDRQDPNNPYNVVDSAPSARSLDAPRSAARREAAAGARSSRSYPETSQPPEALENHAPQRRIQSARTTPSVATARGTETAPIFREKDLRDLALIVELSQRHAPATFDTRAEGNAEDTSGLTLRLAHSAAFEPQLRALFQGRGGLPPGEVVLFSVVASNPEPFYGNLTFVQSGTVYHPSRDDVRDLGLLRSEFGMLRVGEPVLGYARLPESMDLSREIDIYWNDRLLSTILKPS